MGNIENIFSYCSFLGASFVSFVLFRIFNELGLRFESSDKNKSFISRLIVIPQLIFGLLGLPIILVVFFFENKTVRRLQKEHDIDMGIADRKYTFKCTHCYSHCVSASRPFGYDFDNNRWTDKEFSNLYIPFDEICCPSPRQSIDRLSDDLFIVYCEKRPFLLDHIGQKNPYSGKVIETECDYYDYLRDSADAYARKCTDPALFFG